MFNAWNKIDALNQMNRLLLAAVGVLLLMIMGLMLMLWQAPKRMEFWLAPQVLANGGQITSRDIPDEYIHGFVAALIPALNTWSKAGAEEFTQNIQAFHYYFTPHHQQLMTRTLKAFQEAGLFNRVQVASLYRFLEADDIKRLSRDVWEVHLVLRITQRVNDKSPMVIADKVVDYHLRVVHVAISKLLNPFQLALDGYTKPEKLVVDLLSEDVKGDKNDN